MVINVEKIEFKGDELIVVYVSSKTPSDYYVKLKDFFNTFFDDKNSIVILQVDEEYYVKKFGSDKYKGILIGLGIMFFITVILLLIL